MIGTLATSIGLQGCSPLNTSLTGAHCHQQSDAEPEEGHQQRSQPGPGAKPAAQRSRERENNEQAVQDCMHGGA